MGRGVLVRTDAIFLLGNPPRKLAAKSRLGLTVCRFPPRASLAFCAKCSSRMDFLAPLRFAPAGFLGFRVRPPGTGSS